MEMVKRKGDPLCHSIGNMYFHIRQPKLIAHLVVFLSQLSLEEVPIFNSC